MPVRARILLILAFVLCVALGAGPAHADPLALSPDGRLLAQAGENGAVRLWDLEAGQVIRTMHVGQSSPRVAFAPDGASLATAGREGTVILWHVATGRELHRFRATGGAVRSLAFSADGNLLAAGSWSLGEQTVDIWDPGSHDLKRTIRARGEELHAIAFAPKGRTLGMAVGGDGRDFTRLRLVDAWSGRGLATLVDEASGPALCLAFSPDGAVGWVGCDGGRVVAWDTRSRKLFTDFDATMASVRAVAISPDGSTLVAAGAQDSGVLRFWDLSKAPTRCRLIATAPQEVSTGGIVFARDGRVVIVSGPGSLALWDPATGKRIRALEEGR